MKFTIQRKINLSNIDKDIWPYETEDIGIQDADSFEEAQKIVDKLVEERIDSYKAKAAIIKNQTTKVSPLETSGSTTNSSPYSPPNGPANQSMPPEEFNI